MLIQEIIELFMAHITNPNKENAIRMPLADFAFIPEAEAGVIEDADVKFLNVDVRLEGGGAEGWPDEPFYPAWSIHTLHQDSEILFVEEFFRIYLVKPVKAAI